MKFKHFSQCFCFSNIEQRQHATESIMNGDYSQDEDEDQIEDEDEKFYTENPPTSYASSITHAGDATPRELTGAADSQRERTLSDQNEESSADDQSESLDQHETIPPGGDGETASVEAGKTAHDQGDETTSIEHEQISPPGKYEETFDSQHDAAPLGDDKERSAGQHENPSLGQRAPSAEDLQTAADEPGVTSPPIQDENASAVEYGKIVPDEDAEIAADQYKTGLSEKQKGKLPARAPFYQRKERLARNLKREKLPAKNLGEKDYLLKFS